MFEGYRVRVRDTGSAQQRFAGWSTTYIIAALGLIRPSGTKTVQQTHLLLSTHWTTATYKRLYALLIVLTKPYKQTGHPATVRLPHLVVAIVWRSQPLAKNVFREGLATLAISHAC